MAKVSSSGSSSSVGSTSSSSSTGATTAATTTRSITAQNYTAAVHIASTAAAQSRFANRERLRVNRKITDLRRFIDTRTSIQVLLNEMEALAGKAAEKIETDHRRRLDAKFQNLDKQVRQLRAQHDRWLIEILAGDARAVESRVAIAPAINDPDSCPQISADGRLITAMTSDGKITQYNTEDNSSITVCEESTGEHHPQASSDGELIIFEDDSAFWIFNSSTRLKKRLGEYQHNDRIQRFILSSDGSTLACVVARIRENKSLGPDTIYVYDVANNKRKNLDIPVHGRINQIVLSADGNILAYSSEHTAASDIVTCRLSDQKIAVWRPEENNGQDLKRLIGVSGSGQVYALYQSTDDRENSEQTLLYEFILDSHTATVIKDYYSIVDAVLTTDATSLMFLNSTLCDLDEHSVIQQYCEWHLDTGEVECFSAERSHITVDPSYPLGLASDAETIVYEEDGGALVMLNLIQPSSTFEFSPFTPEARKQHSIAQAISALNSTLKGIGGLMLSTRRTAALALATVRRTSKNLSPTLRALTSILPELGKVYTDLDTLKSNTTSDEQNLNSLEAAEALLQSTVDRIKTDADSALTAQANIDPLIAHQLLKEDSEPI